MRHAPRTSLALSLLLLCSVAPTQARERRHAAAPAPAPVTMSPERAALLSAKPIAVPMTQTMVGWIKGCPVEARKEDCSVSGGFSLKPDTAPNLQLTLGTMSTDGTRSLSVMLPLDVALRAGFTVALNDGPAILGDYTTCSANGCSGQVGLSEAEYDRLMHSKQIGLLIDNGRGKALRLDVSLAGLSQVVRGPATSPADMKRRHDAAVEKWQAAKREAEGTPASAPKP